MRTLPLHLAVLVFLISPIVRTADKPGRYPSRPVEIIVPFAPGGGLDVATRLLAKYAQTDLGETVHIRNRIQGGNIAGNVEAMMAPPDGYVLGAWASGLATDELIIPNIPYSHTDVKPLCLFADDPHLIVVGTAFARRNNIATLGDLLEHARAHPGLVTFGVGGNWTTHDFLRLRMEKGAEVRFNRMPFLGGALSARAAAEGNCHVAVPFLPEILPWLGTDKVVVLAVAAEERLSQLPEVPTVGEAGFPGMSQSIWRVLTLPAYAGADIAAYLEWVFRNAARDPGFLAEARLAGVNPVFMGSEETREFVEAEHQRYAELTGEWGIRLP